MKPICRSMRAPKSTRAEDVAAEHVGAERMREARRQQHARRSPGSTGRRARSAARRAPASTMREHHAPRRSSGSPARTPISRGDAAGTAALGRWRPTPSVRPAARGGRPACSSRSARRLTTTTSSAKTSARPWIDRVVAKADGAHEQRAEAVDGEDVFDDHGAAQQPADVHREHGDGRDQRVAQHVLEQDARPLRQALGARDLDIVRGQHVEHGGAQRLDEDRREEQRDGQRRQEQVIRDGRRSPRRSRRSGTSSSVRPKHKHQQQADPERRHGEADHADEPDRVVGQAVAAPRGRR